jgi:hypothetical protein
MNPKRWLSFLALGTVLLTLASARAHDPEGGFTQHYDDTLFQVTTNQRFSAELLLKGPIFTGENSMLVIVHDQRDRDVEGAKVTVRAYPEGREHTAVERQAEDLGHGIYSIRSLAIGSTGNWVLAVDVSKGRQSGTAFFELPEVTGEGAQSVVHPGKSAESVKGFYRVSYEPRSGSIRTGRSLALNVEVLDSAARPVTGAILVVEGELRGREEGLQTRPTVTEFGGMIYVVQGLRFDTPGRWILRFHVFTERQWDTAEFHLVLP